MKRILSLLLLAFLVGSISGQNCDSQVNQNILSATGAEINPTYFQNPGSGQAVTFNNVTVPNTAQNYNFINNGIVTANGGNNLYISGILTPKDGSTTDSDYTARFAFNRLSSAPTDVKQELVPTAYTANGGTIDPSTWKFYQIDPANSVLTSTSTKTPTVTIQLLEHPDTALQVGQGASGKNLLNGASGWFLMNITSSSVNTITTGMDVLDINVNLGCQSEFNCLNYILTTANVDTAATSQTNDNQALFVINGNQGFFDSVTQWEIAPGSTNTLNFDNNGNAAISLNLFPKGTTFNSSQTLVCSLFYYPTAAPSMPKEELNPDQYVENGGQINPFTWAFYGINTETSQCTYKGATLTGLGLQDAMPMQLGKGASGKNTNFGLASWVSFPNGFFDINLDATCDQNPTTSKSTTLLSSFLTLYSTTTLSSSLQSTTNLMTTQPCPLNLSSTIYPPSISTSSITTSSITTSSSSISTSSITTSSISTSSKTTDLPATSEPTPTPTTAAPVETCPPGCQPIPLPTTAPTETPAGNNAANVEISKLLLAVMSLFILAFFH